MISFYQQYQNILATVTGVIVQILFNKKLNLVLIFTIIFTALLVNLYFIYPILDYLKLNGSKWEATFYAVGSALSLALIRMFLNLLPVLIKARLIKSLGLDYEVINNELKDSNEEAKFEDDMQD